MKWIDIPPVWLAITLLATFWVAELQPDVLRIDLVAIQWAGSALIVVGLVFMLLAVFEMRRHKTTVIPHMQADHLVQSGVFKHSRNPIYLGDVLVLAGCILRWDAGVALPLIVVLIWVLRVRFILPEEARLRAKFGPSFDDYCATTRRWI